jgi:hypothetical protein
MKTRRRAGVLSREGTSAMSGFRIKALAAAALVLWAVRPVQADARHEIQFPDVGGYRTLKCDLHEHTVFSDGQVWPTVRVEEAWREGLDVIALTDHIEYQPHKKDIPTNLNRSYELAVNLAEEKNILLVHGAEITRDTPPGHFNALFLTDAIPLDTKDFYEAFKQAAGQGAFVFWNHPGWKGAEKGRWGEWQTKLYESKQLQGIEICNGDEYYKDAHGWAIERGLTVVGNADIHEPSLGRDPTPEKHRTMTLVFAQEKTLDAVKEALSAKRTAVWCQNRLFGREEQLAPLFAACVRISPVFHRDKDDVLVEMHNSCEMDIELARDGAGSPANITLPAKSTIIVKLPAPKEEEALPYRVTNWLTAPDKPLPVKLTIPGK